MGTVTDLGALRAEELRISCARLGIDEPVFLGFHDSARKERQRHDDPRALANVDMLEVERAVRRVIQAVQPHLILTSDPHGGYYHPDHLAIQRATTAAFFSSGSMGHTAPERLFYSTIERDTFQVFAEKSRGRDFTDGLNPDVFGTAADMIAVRFDARPVMKKEWSALAAHRSAFGVTQEMFTNPPPGIREMLHAFQPVLECEAFLLGGTRVVTPGWPLVDFFDGLPSAILAERLPHSAS